MDFLFTHSDGSECIFWVSSPKKIVSKVVFDTEHFREALRALTAHSKEFQKLWFTAHHTGRSCNGLNREPKQQHQEASGLLVTKLRICMWQTSLAKKITYLQWFCCPDLAEVALSQNCFSMRLQKTVFGCWLTPQIRRSLRWVVVFFQGFFYFVGPLLGVSLKNQSLGPQKGENSSCLLIDRFYGFDNFEWDFPMVFTIQARVCIIACPKLASGLSMRNDTGRKGRNGLDLLWVRGDTVYVCMFNVNCRGIMIRSFCL